MPRKMQEIVLSEQPEALLRETIRKLLEAREHQAIATKTYSLLIPVVKSAKKYVRSISLASRDRVAAKELEEATERFSSYANWLAKRRIPWARHAIATAKAAQEITANSGFWKTPKFLNVWRHADKLEQDLKHLQHRSKQLAASLPI